MTDTDIFKKLRAPFPAESIHWRPGATTRDKTRAIGLAYLDARDVMDRLDEVLGPQNWACRYPFPGCCEISIKILPKGEWVTKANCAGETQVEAEKGQASDAFKRAAVCWGVGAYLYRMRNAWFDIEQRGRSYAFTDAAQAEMTRLLDAWQRREFSND